MRRSIYLFNVLLLPLDFVMLLSAGIATYFLRTQFLSIFRPVLFQLTLPFERYFILVLVTACFFILAFAISGLYVFRSDRTFSSEVSKIIVASSAGIMGIIIYIFLKQQLFDSRFLVLGGWLMAIVFVSLGRRLMRRFQHFMMRHYGVGIQNIMVIGDDSTTERIKDFINQDQIRGYRLVKHLINPEVDEVKRAIGNPGVDEVLLANPNYPADRVLELIDFCHENHINFRFIPNLFQALTANTTVDTFAGLPIVELRRTALDGWGKVAKRILDLAGSSLGLIFLSPFLGLFTFVIKWETEGPVFVRLKRVSQNKEFNLFKFRSMVRNAEELKPLLESHNERAGTPLFKMKNDPRVTKVGKFLRKFRLDELPQLWNVLKGDMSLVGPRPHEPQEIARYQKHHKRVLAMKAGASGLAQVSGASDLDFEEEVALDTYYIENWSLWLDVKIIFKTLGKMLFDKSAV